MNVWSWLGIVWTFAVGGLGIMLLVIHLVDRYHAHLDRRQGLILLTEEDTDLDYLNWLEKRYWRKEGFTAPKR